MTQCDELILGFQTREAELMEQLDFNQTFLGGQIEHFQRQLCMVESEMAATLVCERNLRQSVNRMREILSEEKSVRRAVYIFFKRNFE
jgi:hypothetical protein